MGYYNYHGIIKQKIRQGELLDYTIVAKYHHIAPALVLFFKDGSQKPIREDRFHEYFALIDQYFIPPQPSNPK